MTVDSRMEDVHFLKGPRLDISSTVIAKCGRAPLDIRDVQREDVVDSEEIAPRRGIALGEKTIAGLVDTG